MNTNRCELTSERHSSSCHANKEGKIGLLLNTLGPFDHIIGHGKLVKWGSNRRRFINPQCNLVLLHNVALINQDHVVNFSLCIWKLVESKTQGIEEAQEASDYPTAPFSSMIP